MKTRRDIAIVVGISESHLSNIIAHRANASGAVGNKLARLLGTKIELWLPGKNKRIGYNVNIDRWVAVNRFLMNNKGGMR